MSSGLARIPDIAIERGGALSPAAFRLYCYYCARRDKKSGRWQVPNKKAAQALGLSRNRVCEARGELRTKGWIACDPDDFIRPIIGFEPVGDSTRPIENSMASVEDSTGSVENSTGAIYQDRARGFTSHTSHLPPNTKSERETHARATPSSVELPDWLPPDSWRRWDDYCRQIGKTLPPATAAAQVAQLDGYRARGMPPEAVIEQSILRKWHGLYELKGVNGDAINARPQGRGRGDHAETGGREPSRRERNRAERLRQLDEITFAATATVHSHRAPDA